MVFYTPLQFMEQIRLYKEKFDLNLDGKKISTECVDIIVEHCPQLHTREELQRLASNNLKSIQDEFGFKGLRLYLYTIMKPPAAAFSGEDSLQRKYYNLIKEVTDYHNTLIKELTLTLDVYNYYSIIEKVYDEEYGVIIDYNHSLYSLLKTIDLTHYNPEVINQLHDTLLRFVDFCNAKYYKRQDLTDPTVLRMFHEHMMEENFDEGFVKQSCDMIYSKYDGYGNELMAPDYTEAWTIY